LYLFTIRAIAQIEQTVVIIEVYQRYQLHTKLHVSSILSSHLDKIVGVVSMD